MACSSAAPVVPPTPVPAKAKGPVSLKDRLPPAPAGFDAATEVQLRDRDTIFEQINGGSVSFLENGMSDALFATYTHGPREREDISFELYRFKTPKGAKDQFAIIAGNDAKPWEHGTSAVVHDYGLELVSNTLIVRVVYNDGPAKVMAPAAAALARHIITHP